MQTLGYEPFESDLVTLVLLRRTHSIRGGSSDKLYENIDVALHM
jgi:hypothetical protein